jgi:hypothetical protein
VKLNRRVFIGAATGAVLTSRLPAGEDANLHEDNVVELRQYTLRGGQRDTLIALFEKSFIEPQNALGAHVIGTFRDLDDPDRFVWIRGFRDLTTRPEALGAFYGGPIWQANRAAANATMVDSDNVLLLHPSAPGLGFSADRTVRTPNGYIIGATIHYLGPVATAQFAQFFEQSMLPRLRESGAQPIASFVSEESANNFPRLPVRERERVFIWFARWASISDEAASVARVAAWTGWRDSAPEALFPALMRKPERLRLAPTDRSALR